jgi:hypothetical protein
MQCFLRCVSTMDKRSEIHFNTLLMAFFRFTVLFLVSLTMVFFVLHFMKMDLDVFEVESELLIQGFINSEHGISAMEGNRVYAGVIDYNMFKDPALSKRLDDAFRSEKPILAAKIELLSGTANYRSVQPVYYNQDRFNTWYALAKTLFPGPGGARTIEKRYVVLVKDGKNYEQATLKITVAGPNT